jgi:hypothetical protein
MTVDTVGKRSFKKMKNKEPLKGKEEKTNSPSLSAAPKTSVKKATPKYVAVVGISSYMNSPRLKKGDEVPSDWPEAVINKLLKRGSIKAGG